MSAALAAWPNGRCEYLAAWPERPTLRERERNDSVTPGLYQAAHDAGELVLLPGASVDPVEFLDRVAGWLDGVKPALAAADSYRAGEFQAELGKAGLGWPTYVTERTRRGSSAPIGGRVAAPAGDPETPGAVRPA